MTNIEHKVYCNNKIDIPIVYTSERLDIWKMETIPFQFSVTNEQRAEIGSDFKFQILSNSIEITFVWSWNGFCPLVGNPWTYELMGIQVEEKP